MPCVPEFLRCLSICVPALQRGAQTRAVPTSGSVLAVTALAVCVLMLTPTSAEAQVHQGDKTALEAFYDATNGDNWTRRDNWKSNMELETWWGVSTNAAGRVISISLNGSKLSGMLPAELGNLSELTSLSLESNTELGGTIPTQLGNLSMLRTLGLRGNSLSGTIPTQLGNLSMLTTLRLDGNDLTGTIPAELGNLSMLTTLGLQSNELSGMVPPELTLLADTLTILRLSSNSDLTGCVPYSLRNVPNDLSQPGAPPVCFGPSDINEDREVNRRDALAIYYAVAFRDELAGSLGVRIDLLTGLAREDTNDGFWAAINRVDDWRDIPRHDVNGDNQVNRRDALAVYYVVAFREELEGSLGVRIDLLTGLAREDTNDGFWEVINHVKEVVLDIR